MRWLQIQRVQVKSLHLFDFCQRFVWLYLHLSTSGWVNWWKGKSLLDIYHVSIVQLIEMSVCECVNRVLCKERKWIRETKSTYSWEKIYMYILAKTLNKDGKGNFQRAIKAGCLSLHQCASDLTYQNAAIDSVIN